MESESADPQSQVANYMTGNPIYAPSSVSFPDAIDMMADKKIGNLVVTKHRIPIGFLTEREILQYLATEAAKIMAKHNIKRLPLTENGKIVAIVTMRDLVEAFLLGEEARGGSSPRRQTAATKA